jgi:UDP-N-acetylglucosamine diphosphorylase/glucosamine-1-phosphate N-acetyltransferase
MPAASGTPKPDHAMMNGEKDSLILLDDGGGTLGPLTDLRPAFELRSGALTGEERIAARLGRSAAGLIVPDGLAPLVASRRDEPVNELSAGEQFIIINGRCTGRGVEPPATPNTVLVDGEGAVLAARLDRGHAETLLRAGGQADALRPHAEAGEVRIDRAGDPDGAHADGNEPPMLRRPWDLLEHAGANLPDDLDLLADRLRPLEGASEKAVTIVGDHPVLVGERTVIHPQAVIDTTGGPIAVDDGAEIRSMSVLVGPGYVGRGTIITNHAHIRGRCIIGPVCKAGGEINASVFQGYANKAHAGYLGDSFVGAWANLGAGTITSNLKNTYGEIRMRIEPDRQPEPTGRTHLGSILGDHVKTAIGTRLTGGACVHTGAMLALSGFAPKCVDRFAFLTDDPAGEQRYELDKFLRVAEHVLSRRDHALTPALRQRLEALYERTVHHRGDTRHIRHGNPSPA